MPENRAVFTCRQCGFTNLLVPMCLWCRWTSSEAKRDFEINARKSLRRAAFSAPRLFKPVISSSSKKKAGLGCGNSQPEAAPFQVPCASDSPSAVISAITPPSLATVYPPSGLSTTQSPHPAYSISARKNQLRQQGYGDPMNASAEGLGITSGRDKSGPTAHTTRRPPLRADLVPSFISINHIQPGHKNKGFQKDVGCGSACPLLSSTSTSPPPASLESCPPPVKNPGPSSSCPLPSVSSAPFPATPSRGFVASVPSYSAGHGDDFELALPSATVPIRPMQRDAHTIDTRCRASNAVGLNSEQPPLDTTGTRHEYSTQDGESHFYGSDPSLRVMDENIVQMDFGVTTATQSYPQPSASQMDYHEPLGAAIVERPSGSDMNATTNTILTKPVRKRAPIPSILLHQDSNYTPTNVPPSTPNSPASNIPATSETNTENMIKDNPSIPVSPPRTLKRKKRLSAGFAATATTAITALSSSQVDSTQSLPSPQSTPALPVIVTPPTPLNSDPPTTNLHLRTVGIPTPTPALAVPAALDSSRGSSSPKPTPAQPFPRIGTPKRPYFTVIRGSMSTRPSSTVSHLSTPPASPTAPAFGDATARRSPSPKVKTPGCSDSSLVGPPGGGEAQHTALAYTHDTFMSDRTAEGATPASEVVTVPPLPPTVTPVPIPIPVQMRMRPSSPVRSILSVLDPVDDEDDEDMGYGELGTIRGQPGKALRHRSSNLKEKSGGGNGYHFPLSLSLSLGRKRGRAFAAFGFGSERGRERERGVVPPLPTTSTSGNYASMGGFGLGRGCSMSGEMEMKMALAERNLNANGSGGNSSSGFKFRENQGSSASLSGDERRVGGGGGKRLLKMRSTIGLGSSSSPSSPSSPMKPRFGIRLREMSAHLLGRLQ